MFSEGLPLMIIITRVAFIINREKFSASKSLQALLQVLICKQSWIVAFTWALRAFTSKGHFLAELDYTVHNSIDNRAHAIVQVSMMDMCNATAALL